MNTAAFIYFNTKKFPWISSKLDIIFIYQQNIISIKIILVDFAYSEKGNQNQKFCRMSLFNFGI